jgi:hypothetical protein
MSCIRVLERHKRFIKGRKNVKAILIVSFNIRGVIMIEWIPEGQKVNQKYSLEVLTKLSELRKKKLELWNKRSWILH